MNITKPPNGTICNNRNQPDLPESCNLLTVTARLGIISGKNNKTISPMPNGLSVAPTSIPPSIATPRKIKVEKRV